MAAAIASSQPCVILERNSEAGRKLLISGSGQCNLSNALPREDFLRACQPFAAFLKPALYALDNLAVMALLEQHGCPCVTRDDGKVFPQSMRASDVRDTLQRIAKESGADIAYNAAVQDVGYADGFVLHTEDREYRCKKLIIAGGGCSYPRTGSDGLAHKLAKMLGHKINPVRPALSAVSIADYAPFTSCAGISLRDAHLSLLSDGKAHRATGDLLFTHTGLSGPLILDNSHLMNKGDTLRIRLLENAAARITALLMDNASKTLLNALKRSGLPEALLLALLKLSAIDPDQKCAQLPVKQRKRLVETLDAAVFKIARVYGMEQAMLTAGGVSLGEVRARDMGSKLVPGLYFAGEVLDYNLPTGGFNIQAALSTGWLAGSAKLP